MKYSIDILISLLHYQYFNYNQIPVEDTDVEALNDVLLSDEIPKEDIFNTYQEDIDIFLSSDIYPSFKSTLKKNDIQKIDISYEARKRYAQNVEKNKTKDTSGKRAKLETILNNSRLCFYFKKFLIRLEAVDNLMFYLEVADFVALFGTPITEEHDDDNQLSPNVENYDKTLNREFFLSQASDIYRKYIQTGAEQQVIDDYKTQNEIKDKLTTWNGTHPYPYQAFDKASDFIFALIMNNFVDGFFTCPEYNEYTV